MKSLPNVESSIDGQQDYLDKGSFRTCSINRILFANYIAYYPFDYLYSFSL